jgi:hypothetical protein
MTLEFYHQADPNGKKERWPFVYLHGQAEDHCGKQAQENGWEWGAPDIFDASEPMPTFPGDYPATLYGMPVIAFVRFRHGHLAGRVATPADVEGFAHAKESENWR